MSTIPAVLRAAAAAAPDREALVTPEIRLTFAELLAQVRMFSRAARASGISHGDRIGMWAPNTAEWVVAALGLTGIGAVLVPVNTRFKGEEARYLLDRTGVSTLFVDDDFLSGLLGSDPLTAVGNPDVQVIRTSDLAPFLARAHEVTEDDVEKLAEMPVSNQKGEP